MPPIVIATVKLPGFEFLNAALRDSAPFLEEFIPICFGAIHSEGVYHDPNDNAVFGTLATFIDIAELQPVTSIKAYFEPAPSVTRLRLIPLVIVAVPALIGFL